MTTITQGTTGTYTFTAGEQAAISLDPGERAAVVVTSAAGVVRYSDAVSEPRTIGPFSTGDVMQLTATKGDIDYTASVAQLQTAPPSKNKLALAGTSITLRNRPGPSSGLDVYGSDGYFTVANALMGAPFELVGISGNSGMTSSFILGRIPLDILSISPAPNYCALEMWANDAQAGISVATSIANVKAAEAYLLSIGCTPILCTVPPRNDAGQTLAMKRQDAQRNRWAREYARLKGYILWDLYRAVVNGINTGTGGWALLADGVGALNDTSPDQIHPSGDGAYYLAANAIVPKMQALINIQSRGGQPRTSDGMYTTGGGTLVEGNIVPNGTFSGTGGTKGAVATGSLADEWSRQGDGAPAGGGTIVLSKVAKSDCFGSWQQIAISGGSAGDNQGSYQIRSDQDYPSVFGQLGAATWQVGDKIWGQLSLETDSAGWANGGDTNCNLAIRIQFLGATGTTTDTGWGLNGAGSKKTRMASGVLTTPIVAIPPGTTAIYFWIYVVGRGTWRFADAEIRKVIQT